MKIGIISVYVDYHRRGRKNRLAMQPGIGPLLAGLLPRGDEVEIINETWRDPDWRRDYDLLFISSLHPDFDRARQVSHYWRRRGAKTVYGGPLASAYPDLCQPYFDTVVVGDPEASIPVVRADFARRALKARYTSNAFRSEEARPPRFDLVNSQSYTPLCLEATRGCPFECEFCVLTGLGTRHEIRPVADVLRDIRRGQEAVRSRWQPWRHRVIGFFDNNLGGNLAYLRELCAALTPLGLQWYAAVTFNVAANPELVQMMSRAGCRVLYVGLESFNPVTIRDMNKSQNVVRKIRAVIDNCRRNGILLISGLMISPLTDDLDYLQAIPAHLEACGLHIPRFICFESPIPGTPHFRRLAAQRDPVLLPNALLRDFTGYTLTVRPARAPLDEFVGAYREVISKVYAPWRRLRKLADDLSYFVPGGYWFPALLGTIDTLSVDPAPDPARSLVAGSDAPPSETVPLGTSDFDSEEEFARVMTPWRVTDASGAALPQWLTAQPVFERESRPSGRRRRAGLTVAA
ncbi:MAG TPA: radical SAM protein [Burkholderiales bacterium]|nr:radical SAM protein [Burkholderiales bacterium]